MVNQMTPRTYSTGELRAAGASTLFIDYYYTAPANASARRMVDRSDDILGIGRNPAIGGHFFKHLWEGRTSKAWAYADNANRSILDEIGVNERVAQLYK